MFKNEYQGGAVVEIFSAQGKDPVAKWKLSGQPSISKIFDKEVKGFVYSLEGSSQTHKMQLPKDSKMPLVLIQRFLVLQVNVPPGKDFSSELVVTDQGHLKRRLYLSTIHKEFTATPLHARIPLTTFRRNIWCNLCIDLASFTAELSQGAAFLSLDGIVISACCKVRRIFTMRNEPVNHMDKDHFDKDNGPNEEIPKSFQLPPNVQHVTQLVNMERLRQARRAFISSESEQPGSGKASQGPKTPDCSHIAFGSKVAGRPPLTARRSSSLTNRTEYRAKVDPKNCLLTGDHGIIESSQSKACFDVINQHSADHHIPDQACGLETSELNTKLLECWSPSDSLSDMHIPKNEYNETTGIAPQHSLDEAKEEEDGEEIFTFHLGPHSAESGLPFNDAFEGLSFDLKWDNPRQEGERKETCLDSDFIGSEGEEDEQCYGFKFKRSAAYSSPAPLTPAFVFTPKLTSSVRPCTEPARSSTVTHASLQFAPESTQGTEMVAPTRCLSPCAVRLQHRVECPGLKRTRPDGDVRKSISKTSVREIPPEDVRLLKVRESMRMIPVISSTCDLSKKPEQEEDEEEELRMLASLKRQQEEEDGDTCNPGLSTLQVHQCNVSLSISSDDTSTWTQCNPLISEQGHYYQKEMNPLLHSNPREWMDVFSPPIIDPNLQLSKSKEDHYKRRLSAKGSVPQMNCSKDEYLSLLYDSCLNCYFDPQTGKYYKLI